MSEPDETFDIGEAIRVTIEFWPKPDLERSTDELDASTIELRQIAFGMGAPFIHITGGMEGETFFLHLDLNQSDLTDAQALLGLALDAINQHVNAADVAEKEA